MSPSAWVLLAVTWGCVAFFAGTFLLKVLRTPTRPESDERP